MSVSNYPRSVPEIISDLFSQLTTLLRKEAHLARAEMSENIVSVGRGLGLIVGGAVLLIPALVILFLIVLVLIGWRLTRRIRKRRKPKKPMSTTPSGAGDS